MILHSGSEKAIRHMRVPDSFSSERPVDRHGCFIGGKVELEMNRMQEKGEL